MQSTIVHEALMEMGVWSMEYGAYGMRHETRGSWSMKEEEGALWLVEDIEMCITLPRRSWSDS